MLRRSRVLSFLQVALATAVLTPATVNAQIQGTPQAVNQVTGSLDEAIAAGLLLGNSEEIALAEFARERADDDNVRQFAEMMIRDHEKAIAQLKQFAPRQAIQANQLRTSQAQGSSDSRLQQQSNIIPHDQVPNSPTAPSGPASTGGIMCPQLVALQHRAARECLQLMKKELGEKQGSDFDKAFAGSQVARHIGMLAKLKASEEFASPRLKAIIQDSTQMVNQHLDEAKTLCTKLQKESLDQSASRGETNDRR